MAKELINKNNGVNGDKELLNREEETNMKNKIKPEYVYTETKMVDKKHKVNMGNKIEMSSIYGNFAKALMEEDEAIELDYVDGTMMTREEVKEKMKEMNNPENYIIESNNERSAIIYDNGIDLINANARANFEKHKKTKNKDKWYEDGSTRKVNKKKTQVKPEDVKKAVAQKQKSITELSREKSIPKLKEYGIDKYIDLSLIADVNASVMYALVKLLSKNNNTCVLYENIINTILHTDRETLLIMYRIVRAEKDMDKTILNSLTVDTPKGVLSLLVEEYNYNSRKKIIELFNEGYSIKQLSVISNKIELFETNPELANKIFNKEFKAKKIKYLLKLIDINLNIDDLLDKDGDIISKYYDVTLKFDEVNSNICKYEDKLSKYMKMRNDYEVRLQQILSGEKIKDKEKKKEKKCATCNKVEDKRCKGCKKSKRIIFN